VLGEKIRQKIERLKWSLWHGNLYKALDKIEDIQSLLYNGSCVANVLDMVSCPHD
jgi:hypothetical protein